MVTIRGDAMRRDTKPGYQTRSLISVTGKR